MSANKGNGAPPTGAQLDNIQSAEVASRSDPESVLELQRSTMNPNMHYRWVHVRPQRLTRMLAKGYRFVTEDDNVKPLIEQGGAADNKIYNGDTVLMQVPKEQYLAGRKRVAEQTRGRLAAPKAQFRKKAERSGVETSDTE